MTEELGARNKAPEAFRTISEAAEEIGVAPHVLRFWEGKFPLLKPLKRGGGRRFYRAQDMALLRGLKALLQDEGYTIKGVQKLIRDNGIQSVRAQNHNPDDELIDFKFDKNNNPNLSENENQASDSDNQQELDPEIAQTKKVTTVYSNASAKGNGLRLRQVLVKLEAARRILDKALEDK